MSVTTEKEDVEGNVLRYWHDNNIEYNAKRTNGSYKTNIRRFERWLASRGEYTHDCHWIDINLDNVSREQMINPRDVTEVEAESFLKDLSDALSASSQQVTATTLSQAYGWLERKTKAVEDDPIGYVLNDKKDILDSKDGRNAYIIPIEEARYYIRSWNNPKWSCINQITAKYSRRAGGISNLDFEDVNIDHPACEWTVHSEVRHWDDHIVFRPDKSASNPGRKSGNKTSAVAKYPLDDELKQSLLWYLACRPEPESPTDPLFLY